MNMYVVVPTNGFADFAEEVLMVTSKEGMTPGVGQAISDEGEVLNVLEARKSFLKVWVVNQPFSQYENPQCGILAQYGEGASWYVVSLRFRLPIVGIGAPPVFGVSAAERIRLEIKQRLLASGYQVNDEPPSCGSVSDDDLLPETQ
ncbi:hypothetical protein FKB34_04895 [Glycocaulis profundi]|nr:hypothetical protein FKB34_04895 [Glycocaulis profundi]